MVYTKLSVFWRDLLERALATYTQAFLGLIIAGPWMDKVDVTTLRSAAIASIPAGLSVVKSGLARFIGDDDSASLDPEV